MGRRAHRLRQVSIVCTSWCRADPSRVPCGRHGRLFQGSLCGFLQAWLSVLFPPPPPPPHSTHTIPHYTIPHLHVLPSWPPLHPCRLLLTNGADRLVTDHRGNLPLHMSSWWGHLSITFMLLDFALPEGEDGVPAR